MREALCTMQMWEAWLLCINERERDAGGERIMSATLTGVLDLYPDIEFQKMDGFDDCIHGIIERFGQDDIICYDRDKIIEKLMKDGIPEHEAFEYYEFNILGAWMGDSTPCFITVKKWIKSITTYQKQ